MSARRAKTWLAAIALGAINLPANGAVIQTSLPLSSSWPGTPSLVTYAVPNQPQTAASIVPENFFGTRAVTMTIQPTSTFNLGHAVITGSGGAQAYSLHIYNISGGANLPGNYKPSTDGPPPPGVDLLTGPTFTYNGSPSDQFIVFNFDSADQPTLQAGQLYAFEIWPVNNYASSGMFWIRGGGGISTYAPGRAYETNSGNGNTLPFNAPTNFRTPLAGSDRDAVLGLYAPNAIPEPASATVLAAAGIGLLARRRRA